MVQAMNTGHDGSMSTCHANGPIDALRRLESMILQAADAAPLAAIRDQIHSSIDVIIHVSRFADGARRVSSIAEVSRSADDVRVRWLVRGDDVVADADRSRSVTGRAEQSTRVSR
jgi:pilus assembly protein CpaF